MDGDFLGRFTHGADARWSDEADGIAMSGGSNGQIPTFQPYWLISVVGGPPFYDVCHCL